MPEKFTLKNFEGPLDLLLLLIQKDEMQIIEIAIHLLTGQLLDHFQAERDLNKQADQMALLAHLLVLKSRRLTPNSSLSTEKPLSEQEERLTLIEQLLEHCQFKEIAEELHEKESQSFAHFTRMLPEKIASEQERSKELGLADVTLEELKNLFNKIYREAKPGTSHLIPGQKWEVKEKIFVLSSLIAQQKELSFAILFEKTSCREELIVTFLALLELIKQGKIIVILEEHELKFTRPRDL